MSSSRSVLCGGDTVQSVAVGLGLSVSTPQFLCLSLSLCVVVRVLLYLKHLLDDSPNKRGPCVSILCETVCLLTHLMDCKVRKVGELANKEREVG